MTQTEAAAPFAPARGERVAVVAGSGSLPLEVSEELVRRGHRPLVFAVEGEADLPDRPQEYDLVWQAPQELGRLVGRLKREGITHLVLAGGIAVRPPLRTLRLSFDFLKFLPRLVSAYARGDDQLLRAIITHVEANGIKIVGAHEIVPDLLSPEGVLTGERPRKSDWKDIEAARDAARAIGALDIGQAAVAVGGRAIALEGIEGTDGLLQRTRELRNHGRIAGRTRGVLVKWAKPGQELRADLPAIGPDTMDAARAAGLAGIALEAGRTFILQFARTIERANAHGLFIVGLPGDDR